MPFKSKQPEGNGHATQLCRKLPGTLCMHVHSTDGCIKWGKTSIHQEIYRLLKTFKCPIFLKKKTEISFYKIGPLHYFSFYNLPLLIPKLNYLRHFS